MKLGIVLPYSGADMSLPIDRVLEAERLGFDSVWTSEAYGSDAVTPAAWVLARTTRIKVGTAIMQMPARTPAILVGGYGIRLSESPATAIGRTRGTTVGHGCPRGR